MLAEQGLEVIPALRGKPKCSSRRIRTMRLPMRADVSSSPTFLRERISEKEIKSLLPVPVICEIPVIGTPADGSSGHDKAWRVWAAAAVVVAISDCFQAIQLPQ